MTAIEKNIRLDIKHCSCGRPMMCRTNREPICLTCAEAVFEMRARFDTASLDSGETLFFKDKN